MCIYYIINEISTMIQVPDANQEATLFGLRFQFPLRDNGAPNSNYGTTLQMPTYSSGIPQSRQMFTTIFFILQIAS